MFLLMEQFRRELNGDFRLTEPVQNFFRRHTWPGNIRELRNVVEYFIYTDHRDITMEDLPPPCCSPGTPSPVRRPPRRRGRPRRSPPCRIPSGSYSPSCTRPPRPGRPWAGTSCCKRPGSPMFPSLSRRSGPSLRNGGAGAGPGQPRPGRQPADAQGPGAVGNRSKMKSYNHLYQFDQ